MKYNMTIKREGNYAELVFTRKNGETDDIYLGYVGKEGMLADQVLSKLYDFHQCDDEFGPDDTMEVSLPDGQVLGTFEVLEKMHIVPADEDTKLAVQGVTKEKPYRVSYDAPDGQSSESFATLADAAKYVKDRWQGVEYVDGRAAFHTDYARYLCFGFKLADIGTLSGSGVDRTFAFKESL